MKDFITVTRKGQATLPAELRRKLGVPKSGGTLKVYFNDQTKEAVMVRPTTIEEVAGMLTKYIRPGTKPVRDVSAYYNKHRRATAQGVE